MPRIEEFHPDYQTGVVDLIVGIQRNEYDLPIDVEQQPDLFAIPSYYQSGYGAFLVALNGAAVVGTAALKDIGDGNVALRKMFVAPSFRGKEHGLAARLLNQLITQAKANGLKTIFLGTTEKFLAAHRFYEKHGFVQIPRELLPKGFPLVAVDTRFYALQC